MLSEWLARVECLGCLQLQWIWSTSLHSDLTVSRFMAFRLHECFVINSQHADPTAWLKAQYVCSLKCWPQHHIPVTKHLGKTKHYAEAESHNTRSCHQSLTILILRLMKNRSLIHLQNGDNKRLEAFRVQGIQEAEKERCVCCYCPFTKGLGKTDQLSRSQLPAMPFPQNQMRWSEAM